MRTIRLIAAEKEAAMVVTSHWHRIFVEIAPAPVDQAAPAVFYMPIKLMNKNWRSHSLRYGFKRAEERCNRSRSCVSPSVVQVVPQVVGTGLVDGGCAFVLYIENLRSAHVQAWEAGRRNPGPKHLAKLAEVLGLQIIDLLPTRK